MKVRVVTDFQDIFVQKISWIYSCKILMDIFVQGIKVFLMGGRKREGAEDLSLRLKMRTVLEFKIFLFGPLGFIA